jgi:hypothetical protein
MDVEDYNEWLKYVLDWRNLWRVLWAGIGPSNDGLPPEHFSRPLFQGIYTFKRTGTLFLSLLEFHATSTGKYLPTFRRMVELSSSGSSSPKRVLHWSQEDCLTSTIRTLGSFEKSTPIYQSTWRNSQNTCILINTAVRTCSLTTRTSRNWFVPWMKRTAWIRVLLKR